MIKPQDIYIPLYTNKDKFIVLVTGGRGCEAPDTRIMMADLTIKAIKDIRVGDTVMGDDGTPRRVLETLQGRSEMFKVHQTSAEDYVVNDAHILTTKKSASSKVEGRYNSVPDVLDINVKDYAAHSKRFREHFRGFKSGSIPYPEHRVLIEPYMLGVWLGDGTATFPQITTMDEEVVDYIRSCASRRGMCLTINGDRGKAKTYRLRKVGGRENPFMRLLRHYDLINNKHIPQDYISNSERVRLELLAGLLDTDGYAHGNVYEITQKSEVLSRQIKFIADTLGFRTNLRPKRATLNGKEFPAYRLTISGDLWRIPCKVKHKILRKEDFHKNKDWHLSQLEVESVGEGDWCGIIIDGNHRYLHADGTVTHNSGKSFNCSAFIERLTFVLNKVREGDEIKRISHQILYTRYTMVSAGISIIPEFLEKAELEGTSKYFASTKTDVVNTLTGSRIMFRGIKTSSGNQTAKLKSIHGISCFVVDEAEEWTSERDFETIMLSIRQKGIQNYIFIIMNPTDSNHWVYKRFIKDTHKIVEFDGVPVQISTHPNVLHIHTSYLDNLDHLSESFLKEVQYMKATDPAKYAHQVMGQWSDVAEGAIYKTVYECDGFPEWCEHVGIGLDLGYSNDPTAAVLCGIVGDDVYLEELFYQTHLLSKDIAEKLRGYGLKVISDSADPRLIEEIYLAGVNIYPVQKGAGSINAGIDFLQGKKLHVVRTSTNLLNELRNYVWDKDKNGNYTNTPVDRDNHCFVAGTLVRTLRGDVPIERVQVGDLVLTSQGWRRVLRTFDNGEREVITAKIETAGGTFELTGTPDHKIKTESGWKPLSELTNKDVIFSFNGKASINAISIEARGTQHVYDIEVEEAHEFYAGGVLVHNCCDAFRYWALGELLGRIKQRENTSKYF